MDPITLHAAAGRDGGALWLQPESGLALVAIGEAWATRPSGEERFRVASAAWQALLEDAVVGPGDVPRMAGPLLIGGFAFDETAVPSTTWEGFESGCLVLPALLLAITPGGAWLTASIVLEPGGEAAEANVRSLQAAWASLVEAPARPVSAAQPSLRLRSQLPDQHGWGDSVVRLAGAVGRGRLDKAVLSRQVVLEASSAIDVTAVLRHLESSAPEATIFAFSRGSRTFVGATPERLVSLEGRMVRTMAMAGSARRGDSSARDDALAASLLASDKEREEHAVVVAMLREALSPVVEDLAIPPVPEVVRFRHVQHLLTPVSARLSAGHDVLGLVERLHPTPAVGGAPRELALELIAEEEPHARGWYAGPLGWVNRHGEGEFMVALRSGVVEGERATLYAGCGIVADSDPEREWDESAAKLQALGSALGRLEP
jgi:isochorismate synthase